MKQLFMILAMAVVSVTAANAQEEPKQVGEKVETKACCKDKKEKSCSKSDKKECTDKKECADKKKCSDKQECKKECSSKGEKKSCCKKEA